MATDEEIIQHIVKVLKEVVNSSNTSSYSNDDAYLSKLISTPNNKGKGNMISIKLVNGNGYSLTPTKTNEITFFMNVTGDTGRYQTVPSLVLDASTKTITYTKGRKQTDDDKTAFLKYFCQTDGTTMCQNTPANAHGGQFFVAFDKITTDTKDMIEMNIDNYKKTCLNILNEFTEIYTPPAPIESRVQPPVQPKIQPTECCNHHSHHIVWWPIRLYRWMYSLVWGS